MIQEPSLRANTNTPPCQLRMVRGGASHQRTRISAHTFTHMQRSLALLLSVMVLLLAACGERSTTRTQTTTTQKAAAQPAALAYVAIGASDSFGVGTDDPAVQCWPSVLAANLGQPVHLVNLGIPGATVAQAVQEELPVGITAQPDAVTVLLGTNDIIAKMPADEFGQELDSLLQALGQQTKAHVFVANLPDLAGLPYFKHADPIALAQTVNDYNAQIAADAAINGATLVDLNSAWREIANSSTLISSDGLHPSVRGAQSIAAAFAIAMKPILHTT